MTQQRRKSDTLSAKAVNVLLGAAVLLAGAAIAWGSLKARVDNHDRQLEKIEAKMERLHP